MTDFPETPRNTSPDFAEENPAADRLRGAPSCVDEIAARARGDPRPRNSAQSVARHSTLVEESCADKISLTSGIPEALFSRL